MTKRKKLRTSGGALYPPRPPKDPRLGESDGGSQSPTLRCWQHLEESDSRSGPSSSPEHSQEQPGQAGPSSQGVDIGAARRLPGPLEKEPPPFPLSQNAAGRFIPQFAKSRKTATLRKAESGDEDPGSSGIPSSEAPSLSEPCAPQVGSQPLAESLQETQGLGHQTESDSACPGHSSRDPVASSKDTLPTASGGEGAWPCVSERASQDPGAHMSSDESSQETKRAWVPVSCGQEGPLLGSEAAGMGAEAGAPQEGGTQGAVGADLLQGPQEEEDATPGSPVSAPALGPPRGPGPGTQGETASGLGSLGRSSPGAHVATEPAAPEQRALQVAAPSSAASPGRTAPDGGHSPAPLGHTPLARDSPGGRGEAGPEDTSDSPAGPPGNREPAVGAADSGHAALETSPDVTQRQGPGPEPPDLEGLGPSLGASALPGDRHAAADPAQERRAPQDRPEAAWEAASATELDFLPDSQIQGALDLEAPPQQVCPAGPCWPDPSPLANRDPVAVARPQQRAPEAAGMEDATDTVRGLILELSNLNRLIMGAHRDLDAFRRLQHRKTAAAGRGPGPYAPQYPWRGL
ncbi:break repair meiotic recombinase recruitment factor 1 [Lepus europaeus]|uniref:break repair meiotic recombinase recruitment factor 1 n=1 Tax=Lepus europaeus TaxID=9983 RepID=UPI002B474EF4|nr:break repair meiotic recombinase recruitment factor 1 [Lepus europaeus]